MKQKNLIIKIFIAIFICFLIYPNTGLFRGSKNVAMIAKENRNITPFPQESFENKKFYTNFERWYQDRLRYRDVAIEWWRKTNFEMGVILKDNIFIGKNSWLFNRWNIVKAFKDEQIKVDNIKKLQSYCLVKGKAFYLMIPPPKEAVYADYFPEHEQRKVVDYYEWENKLRQLMKSNNVNYLSVTDELFNMKGTTDGDLYFNDDHHWSYYGSAIAVSVLLNKFSNDGFFLDAKLDFDGSVKNAYKECSYFGQLGFGQNYKTVAPWNNNFTDEVYVTNSYSREKRKISEVFKNGTLWWHIVRGEAIIENKSLDSNVTVLVLGDSYCSYMAPYLSQKVSRIIATHYHNCAGKKKKIEIKRLIEEYNPDIVVLEIVGYTFFQSKGNDNFKNMVFQ